MAASGVVRLACTALHMEVLFVELLSGTWALLTMKPGGFAQLCTVSCTILYSSQHACHQNGALVLVSLQVPLSPFWQHASQVTQQHPV